MLCLVNVLLDLNLGKYLCHNFTTMLDSIYLGLPLYMVYRLVIVNIIILYTRHENSFIGSAFKGVEKKMKTLTHNEKVSNCLAWWSSAITILLQNKVAGYHVGLIRITKYSTISLEYY